MGSWPPTGGNGPTWPSTAGGGGGGGDTKAILWVSGEPIVWVSTENIDWTV